MVCDITNISHFGKLYNVTPGMGVASADGKLGCGTWSNVAFVDEFDPEVDTLSFCSFADQPLSIFASSEEGDTWDIVFGTGDAENPVLTFENLANGPLEGVLFQYDAGADAYDVVGSFSGTVGTAMTLDGYAAIPEPATITLLLTAAGVVVLGGRWRRAAPGDGSYSRPSG